MDDTAQKAVVFAMVAIAIGVVVGLLFLVRRGPGLHAARLATQLMQVNLALGFAPRPHRFRVHWLAPERETTALYAEIGGRPVLAHYCAYVPQSMGRTIVGLPHAPVHETWIEAAVRPTLALGADEPSDPIAIRRGLGPGEAGTGLVIPGSTQTFLVSRRAAALRLMSLLDDPRLAAHRSELGPHALAGSDDTALVALSGLADAARIRRACEIACAIAATLPELRRELAPNALDAAVARLSEQSRESLGGTGIHFDVGASSGAFVTLDLFASHALDGLGTLSKEAGGLIHRVRYQSARLPARFDTPAVHEALRALGAVPELVSVDVKGVRLRFVAHPVADHRSLIAAAFGLARALAVG